MFDCPPALADFQFHNWLKMHFNDNFSQSSRERQINLMQCRLIIAKKVNEEIFATSLY